MQRKEVFRYGSTHYLGTHCGSHIECTHTVVPCAHVRRVSLWSLTTLHVLGATCTDWSSYACAVTEKLPDGGGVLRHCNVHMQTLTSR